MELTNKTVVVIGGGSGIGRAGAIEFARAGSNVVVADIDEAAARETSAVVESLGRRSLTVTCDASNVEDLARLHRAADVAFGQVDVLWAHAGKALAGPLEQIPLDRWQELLNLNCLGPVAAFLEFGPTMLARGEGHLIITSSSLGLFPEQVPIAAPYVLTKAGLNGFARALDAYARPQGVSVTLLCPDATLTKHAVEVPLIGIPAEQFKASLDLDAMQRPAEVAVALVESVRAGTFMVTLTPDARNRLHEDTNRLLGTPDPSDRGPSIIQSGRLAIDPANHDAALAAVESLAAESVKESGNRTFQWTADLRERGVFHVFEEWDSQEAIDIHGASAHGRALLAKLPELGVKDVALRSFAVAGSHDVAVPG